MHGYRLFILFATLFCLASAYAADTTLSGRVQDESGRPLAGAEVDVNGLRARTDASGQFTATVGEAAVYTLRYAADGHYGAVHSFSPLELEWFSDDTGSRVPAVSLVERRAGRVMMAFGGDAMMGRRFSDPYPGEPVMIREGHEAQDTRALLRHVRPYLELADFASVNLETQVMVEKPEAEAPKSFTFFTPPAAVAALRDAGVDYVTLGNNHSNDYLAEGMSATLDALAAAGMPFSGGGLNEADALQAHTVKLGGRDYSFLGYVGWAGNFSPNQVAEGSDKSGAALGSSRNISLTVGREAAAGRLPVVQYHGSLEYSDEPTLVTESRLKQAVDEGAVLAIAHHPHIVQGFEIYRGRLLAYSLGNFIFDQYHPATQYSYMIYVWMDGDRLHRAEVMPLHIQGYTPMPATDTVRQKVLKRAHELSSRRGIAMGRSGGNGVILPDNGGAETADKVLRVSRSAGHGHIVPLHERHWNATVGSIEAEGGRAVRLRLGENLLPTGHLENYRLHDSPDRSWIEDGGQEVADDGSGNQAMRLVIPAGAEEGRIGMRTFEYTFDPGRPSTFALRARVGAAATVTAYQQWRGRNDRRRFEALETNRLRAIGKVELEPGDWRELRFDFDSPRVSAVSYRIVLRVEPQDPSRAHESWFDDLALIEWLTPPLDPGEVPPFMAVQQASHADVIVP